MAAARTPRLSKAALFEKVGYRPHPLQWEIHQSTVRRRTVATGCRFGKSTLGEHEALAALMAPCVSSLGWLVAPSFEVSGRSFDKVVAVVKQHFPTRVVLHDARARRLIVINLGGGRSEARAKSTESPAGLLGESLTWCIIDEAASIRRDHAEVLMQRLVDQRGWSLALSVPKGAGWFFDAFRLGQRKRDPDSRSWTAPTWANPFVDPAVVEAERARISAEDFDEQFGGRFIGVAAEPCMTCNGPNSAASGVAIIDRDAGEQLLRCAECDLPIDKDGRSLVTLWPNGRSFVMVLEGVSLCDRPPRLPIEIDESNVAGSSPI